MSIKKFVKKIQIYQRKKGSQTQQQEQQLELVESSDIKLQTSLEQNIDSFKKAFGNSNDFIAHEFKIFGKTSACLVYLDGMVNNALVSDSIMRPLVVQESTIPANLQGKPFMQHLKDSVLLNADCTVSDSFSEFLTAVLAGDSVVLADNCEYGVSVSVKGYQMRAISEPQSELVVRGPREGFNENLRTNTALLRRIIRSPKLRLENMVVGEKTATNVCIAYIEGVANPGLIRQVKNRINKIDVDSILDSGYIEEYIEDSPFSLFPTIGYTEKPDVCCGKILEGRVAIIVDGSPFAITMPYLFIENFQTAEDYYVRPIYASVWRIMRLISYFISIFLLPLYIAMTTYHQELIPTTLLFTIANAREGTPFPAFIEALILVLSFEILREAGVRLPRAVGQAISIVGALIMGDAAVAAGLVGAPMVIAVAISAVATFVTPEQIDNISLLRLLLMIAATAMGGYGIALGFLAIIIHLASLNSFDVPYFDTFVFSRDLLDGFVRFPLWTMNKRPKDLAYGDVTRIVTFVPPTTNSPAHNHEGSAAANQQENGQDGNSDKGETLQDESKANSTN